jgi:glycosyltransferase involved in cell wall biosynthesis
VRYPTYVLHLIHSRNPQTGGVCSAVELLNEELVKQGVQSRVSDDPNSLAKSADEWLIAHGLWQWPGRRAQGLGNRYLVYPHGMLDPWFKKTYPLKHLKKQFYWWLKQGSILRGADAVCFTTEEERLLAQKTFFPYRAKEVVTGLGVTDPPEQTVADTEKFHQKFPNLKDQKYLLYLGRFHPKKGVDDLIRSWKNRKKKEDEVLVLAGPLQDDNEWIKYLQNLAKDDPSIVWTDMLKGDLKWSALRLAHAMILPSHQENYGMVVAEACSVGLPVYLTDKVNLWREVVNAGAGTVESDTPIGIENLVNQWSVADRDKFSTRAQKCFRERLHISRTVENLVEIMQQPAG